MYLTNSRVGFAMPMQNSNVQFKGVEKIIEKVTKPEVLSKALAGVAVTAGTVLAMVNGKVTKPVKSVKPLDKTNLSEVMAAKPEEMYSPIKEDNIKIGTIKQEWSMWKPKYKCDLENYEIDGNIWGLQYQIKKDCNVIATINKKLFSLNDTYIIDSTEEDLFNALLIAVAIDATNCSKNSD